MENMGEVVVDTKVNADVELLSNQVQHTSMHFDKKQKPFILG